MTGLQLVADDLDREIPGLLASSTVVALVPATELRGWAAEMAWRVARAAAAGGRRTVLVDCFVDSPTLHGASDVPHQEGLVDAFEYGASLNRIVQQQPQADLFFIPAGTYAADAEPVLQNPRWKRLSAGFRHEEALLLLYVGAEHLGTIPADPDGIVVLAPQGQDLAVADAPALAGAVAEGLPLLAVVAEDAPAGLAAPANEPSHPAPEPSAARPAKAARASGPAPVSAEEARHARVGLVVASLFIVALGAGTAIRFGALNLLRSPAAPAGSRPGRARPETRSERPRPSGPAVAERGLQSATGAPSAATAAAPAGEPLPFALEVAVLPRLAQAFEVADSLEAHGTRTMIAPGRVNGRGVFYRVHAGPFASRAAADSARAALIAGGLIARTAGTVTSVPLSVALNGPLPQGAAASERTRLRRAGVPAFVLGQPDGSYRVYAGAFARTVSRTLLYDLFTPTGGAGELVTRAGAVQ